MNSRPVLVITGPTASGKSALAVAVASMAGGEIVCADAYQVYAGLPVLTAQPGSAEQKGVPHHLYGFVPLHESMDAARLATRVHACIAEIQDRRKLPVLVSGGGLYLAAITHGLDALPPGDPALRARLDLLSPAELTAQLLALDPDTARTGLNLRNPRHVSRALEICLLTGQPASALKQSFSRGPDARFKAFRLDWPREELYSRINQRTMEMLDSGAPTEAGIIDPASMSRTAARTLGFREFHALHYGHISAREAVASIQQATRQYAKRQESWLRGQTWIIPASPAVALDTILATVP